MMTAKPITYNGAKITFRKETIRDHLNLAKLAEKLGEEINEDMAGGAYAFAYLLAQTEVEGDLGFPLLDTNASSDDLLAAFEGFLEADVELFDALLDVALPSEKKAKD